LLRNDIISQALINHIRDQYALNWQGIHGINHLRRVHEIGLTLADMNRAKRHVVELFAFLHDARRRNDAYDPKHGSRAARFVRQLQGSFFHISQEDLELLEYACHYHTKGLTEADITVQTCWDSDRLDLGRVGIMPRVKHLCTEQAKDPHIIQWAHKRSVSSSTWSFNL
jgi:uncharacterized protein